jgi:cob(I)alamin adenosyltransferase
LTDGYIFCFILGITSTFAGSRLPKDHSIFDALGSNDYLSSILGHGREFCDGDIYSPIPEQLKRIQCILQDVGSHIATPRTKASTTKQERTKFEGGFVEELEQWIDSLDSELPPLQNFILPSGGKAATVLHMARAVCRETERKVVVLLREEDVGDEVYKYINRLSDYLFVAARYVAKVEGRQEEIYIRPD